MAKSIVGGVALVALLVLLALSFHLAWFYGAVAVFTFFALKATTQLINSLRVSSRGRFTRSVFWLVTVVFLFSIFWDLLSRLPDNFHRQEFAYVVARWAIATSITTITTLIIALSILIFLRSRTLFQKWTYLVAGVLVVLLFVLLEIRKTTSSPRADIEQDASVVLRVVPTDAFLASIRSEVLITDSDSVTYDDVVEIRPKFEFIPLQLDHEWLKGQTSIDAVSEEHFAIEPAARKVRQGLRIKYRRVEAKGEEDLGLYRSKLSLSPPYLRIIVGYDEESSPASSANKRSAKKAHRGRPSSSARTQLHEDFALGAVSVVTVKHDIRLPSHSFIASYPLGTFTALPDRDQLSIEATGEQYIELYYLKGLRFGLLQSSLQGASASDLVIKTSIVLFWPVILLLLGDTQQKVRSWFSGKLQRKPKQWIGF